MVFLSTSEPAHLDGRAERLVLAPATRRKARGRAAARGAELLEQEKAGLEEAAVAVAVCCVMLWWCV